MAEYNTSIFQVKADEYEFVEPLGYDLAKQSTIQGEIIVLFVNPSSKHQDEAVRFIAYTSQQKNTGPILCYALHSSMLAPYEDPKRITRVKALEDAKADLQKRLTVAQISDVTVIEDEMAHEKT